MHGAPTRAIQELAGHQDLGTTQRYMHLSPSAIVSAIQPLETTTSDEFQSRGEITEAAGKSGQIPDFPKKSGGGGGSRTRVRKYLLGGIYMRIRF